MTRNRNQLKQVQYYHCPKLQSSDICQQIAMASYRIIHLLSASKKQISYVSNKNLEGGHALCLSGMGSPITSLVCFPALIDSFWGQHTTQTLRLLGQKFDALQNVKMWLRPIFLTIFQNFPSLALHFIQNSSPQTPYTFLTPPLPQYVPINSFYKELS